MYPPGAARPIAGLPRACTLGACPPVRAPRTPWHATQWPHPVGLPPAPSLGRLRGAPPSLAPVWAARARLGRSRPSGPDAPVRAGRARPGRTRPPQRPRGAAPGAPPHQPPPWHPPAPRHLGAGAAAARLLTAVRPPTATQHSSPRVWRRARFFRLECSLFLVLSNLLSQLSGDGLCKPMLAAVCRT